MTASNINASGAEPVTTDGPVGGGVLSDAVFRTIFVQSPEAISVTRAHDHVMVEVNQEWLNLTGFSRAQVLGRTATDTPMHESQRRAPYFMPQSVTNDLFRAIVRALNALMALGLVERVLTPKTHGTAPIVVTAAGFK